MRFISLYTDIRPNKANSIYYWGSTKAKYRNLLVADFLKSIQADNYRVNNNTLCVKYFDEYEKVTYVIETDNTDTNYMQCYQIEGSISQSGNVYFRLSLDIWGTYICNVTYSDMHITKSTKKFDNSILPTHYDVKTNEFSVEPLFTPSGSWLLENASKYALLVYVSIVDFESVIGNNRTTNTTPLAIGLDTIIDNYGLSVWHEGIIGVASQIASNIFNAEVTNVFNGKARPISAYIVRKNWITTSNDQIKLSFRTKYDNFVTKTWAFDEVLNKSIKYNYSLDTSDYKYKYFFGTYYNAIPIKPYADTTPIGLKVTTDQTAFKIEIMQNETSHDITQDFSLILTGGSVGDTILDSTMQYIGAISKGITGIASGIATGNPLPAVTGVAGGITSLINTKSSEPTQHSTQGSAFETFGFENTISTITHDKLRTPLYLVKYAYNAPVIIDITFNGVDCDKYLTMTEYVTYENIVGTGAITFIKADLLDIGGVPDFAAVEINNALNGGIRLEYE